MRPSDADTPPLLDQPLSLAEYSLATDDEISASVTHAIPYTAAART
jgi:hypothetical protein